jgi:hypothetical protein
MAACSSERRCGKVLPLAVVGDGDLTQNPYFVDWSRRGGEFVRLANERGAITCEGEISVPTHVEKAQPTGCNLTQSRRPISVD